jgi:hypothetical protein
MQRIASHSLGNVTLWLQSVNHFQFTGKDDGLDPGNPAHDPVGDDKRA